MHVRPPWSVILWLFFCSGQRASPQFENRVKKGIFPNRFDDNDKYNDCFYLASVALNFVKVDSNWCVCEICCMQLG